MRLADLVKDLPPDKIITVRYLWAPEHTYVLNDGEWAYEDGGEWHAPTDVNRPENLADPNFNPNDPFLDEEYSHHGTVAELYEKAEDYDFILEEDATQIADGVYEILREE